MKKGILLRLAVLFLISIIACPTTNACTSAIISGRATRSGRPLLWKHRDTGSTEWNHIEHLKGKRFAYTGLVNSDDKTRKEVWAGANERGFAIMNTASYNMKPDSLKYLPEREGEIMKQALGECANVAEFEEFLKKMPQPRALETNFGVIDAEGEAAYFEVWDYGYTKYDVNDSIQAPNGYIIRSNYSFSGVQDDGKGYIRYQNAEYLMHRAYATGELSVEWIFSSVSRSFFNAILEEDLLNNTTPRKWAVDQDYIPRYTSSASVIVEGIAKGESVDATTIYSILGYPPCGYAVAAWVKAGDNIAEIITGKENGRATANRLSVTLKHNVFPIKRGNGNHYIRMDIVARSIAALRPYEQKFIRAAGATRDRIAKEGFKKEYVSEYNQFVVSAAPDIEETINNIIIGK